jgi:hypothetical protein
MHTRRANAIRRVPISSGSPCVGCAANRVSSGERSAALASSLHWTGDFGLVLPNDQFCRLARVTASALANKWTINLTIKTSQSGVTAAVAIAVHVAAPRGCGCVVGMGVGKQNCPRYTSAMSLACCHAGVLSYPVIRCWLVQGKVLNRNDDMADM